MVDLNLEVLLRGYCVHHPLSHLTSWLTVNQKQFILGKREARKEWVCGVIWHKHIYNLWHSTDTEHALKLYQNFTDTWSVFNNTGSAAMSVDYRSIFTYLLWGRWTDAWLRVLVGLWLRSSRKCNLTVGWGIPLENFRRVCEIYSWLHTMEWHHTL